MHTPSLLSLSCALSLIAAPLGAAELQPKQLAGPPEEFAQMRAPEPAESAILSKSALLPVELAPAGASARWQGSLPVENGHLRFMVLAGDQQWDAAVAAPRVAGARAAAAPQLQAQRTRLGSADSGTSGMRYAVDAAQNGVWSLTLQSASPTAQRGYVLMEGDPRTQLASYPRHRHQQVGQSLTLNALLSGSDAQGAGLLAGQAGQIDQASLRVLDPQGTARTFAMADDGKHDDGAAGDGVYGGSFQPTSAGTWIAQVIVHGRDQAGQPFVRTSEHVLPVLDTSVRLLGNALSARAADGTRLSIGLPIAARGQAPTHYRVFGQVWGTDAKGKQIPVAWIGGMLTPQQGQLPLSLDERWVARAGARAPFTLRGLRIEDPDHYIPLAQADTLPLRCSCLHCAGRVLRAPRPASMKACAWGRAHARWPLPVHWRNRRRPDRGWCWCMGTAPTACGRKRSSATPRRLSMPSRTAATINSHSVWRSSPASGPRSPRWRTARAAWPRCICTPTTGAGWITPPVGA